MQATIISIGDEILIGQIVNTNAAWMGQQLNWAGIKVQEVLVIADQAAAITTALDHALQQSEIVLITGGLGPTKDDVTKLTLAHYFNSKMVLHEGAWQDIKSYLERRKRPILESIKEMAMMPEAAEVIRNLRGTAAAMWFEKNNKVVVAMPGVPHEMKDFMKRAIIPRLQAKYQTPTIVHKVLMCGGLGEAIVAEKIKSVEANLPPYIKLAYLPNMGILRLRLSAAGSDETKIREEVEANAAQIKQLMTDKYIYGEDEALIEEVIGRLLIDRKASLSTAESCTGGLIAHRLTSISGSSAYFMGGFIAYANAQKQAMLGVKAATLAQHGAVSEETIKEMLDGALARTNTDFSIAVSGIAGPTGGTAQKPVGTIWVGVTDKRNGKKNIEKFQLTQNRDVNVKLTTNMALLMLRRLILGID